jgi:outer membrane protein OmpA-like peptidoglycan-associated protein
MQKISNIIVYFHNDQPNPKSWNVRSTIDYGQSFSIYLDSMPIYFSHVNESQISGFFQEVKDAKYDLDAAIQMIASELNKGRSVHVELGAYASPLARSSYNENLTKRRMHSVKTYFLSQLSAVEYDSKQLNISWSTFGESKAAPGVSTDPLNRGQSVYSIEASRERRVTISIEIKD